MIRIFSPHRYNLVRNLLWDKHLKCLSTSSSIHQQPESWTQPVGFDTGIRVLNSLTKRKDPFILLRENTLTWYMCGPTVYDRSHIGHACCYVRFDIIRRILQNYFNINVFMVMGITDIDDKIINRALREEVDFRTLTKRYETEFYQDMSRLNVLPATITTRVTDYMSHIAQFIVEIMKNGYAYLSQEGNVYFDSNAYGKERVGRLQKVVRSSDDRHVNSDKKDMQDFALWKVAKPGEPCWESPWGSPGRPGWHIECSAMASAVFGKSLDLHTGGRDLIFPHHESEIAQCHACHQTDQWTNYFMHTGHLHLADDFEKMSRSLQNTISISEFLNNYTANQFRLYCLETKYHKFMEFTDMSMNLAVSRQRTLQNFLNMANAYIRGQITSPQVDSAFILQRLKETKEKVHNLFLDDFNTTHVLDEIMNLVNIGNKILQSSDTGVRDLTIVRDTTAVAAMANYVTGVLGLFGIDFSSRQTSTGESGDGQRLADVMGALLEYRGQVRSFALAKDLSGDKQQIKEAVKEKRQERASLMTACDNVRDNLRNSGIYIKDSKKSSIWEIQENIVEKKNS